MQCAYYEGGISKIQHEYSKADATFARRPAVLFLQLISFHQNVLWRTARRPVCELSALIILLDDGSLTFAGFPTLAPITFHLSASYCLMAARRAAL